MAKLSPADKAIEMYGIAGTGAADFVRLVFDTQRLTDAERLTEKFAHVIKADSKLARIRGAKYANDPTRADEAQYFAHSIAPNERDETFTRKLPRPLRQRFLEAVTAEKTASFHAGKQDVAQQRNTPSPA